MITLEQRKEIVALLTGNARMPVTEIADRLQLDAAEVEAAIKQLVEDRIIIGFLALVDEEKLHEVPKVRAMVDVEVQPERNGGFDRVATRISRFPEVKTVYLVSGRYDLRLEVEGNSLQEIAFFVASNLASIDGVKATDSHFLLKKYKEAGLSMHKGETYERLKVAP